VKSAEELVIALVGQPNVGKSVVMNHLTGAGAVVSNYPGTTVELTEAEFNAQGTRMRIIDTPGIYSLHSDTEEQRVTHRVLLEDEVDLIINVVDASHLERSLYLTLQLLDLEIPMIIALNQVDMAKESGMIISDQGLSDLTGVPVFPMVAVKGEGLQELKTYLQGFASHRTYLKVGRPMVFSPQVEAVIGQFEERLAALVPSDGNRHLSHPLRALAIHLLEHDRLDEALLAAEPELKDAIESLQKDISQGTYVCKECFRGCAFCPRGQEHPALVTCLERTQAARDLAAKVTHRSNLATASMRAKIESLLDAPFPGIPALIAVAFFSFAGVRWFMDLSEEAVTTALSPITRLFLALSSSVASSPILSALVSAIPDGFLIPLSIVFPAMIAIYTVMAVLEDTGLLPRMAVAADRLLSPFGVPGQAIIPLILAFGCKVPAVLSARAVPGKKARSVLSILLTITIPCAATMGALAGLSQKFGANLAVMYGSSAAVFLLLGLVLGQFVPREEREMALEVPPLRAPQLDNVLVKLWMRLRGFFSHVLPILVLTSVGIRILLDLGVLSFLAGFDKISVRFLGIRGQSLVAVAISAVQRYMGPVVLMNLPLSAREATIAGAMISVSLPCLPTSVLLARENGWRTLVIAYAAASAVSLCIGFFLNALLPVF